MFQHLLCMCFQILHKPFHKFLRITSQDFIDSLRELLAQFFGLRKTLKSHAMDRGNSLVKKLEELTCKFSPLGQTHTTQPLATCG